MARVSKCLWSQNAFHLSPKLLFENILHFSNISQAGDVCRKVFQVVN